MDAIECIMTRRSSGRLVEPAPSAGDLDALLRAAMAGPDHGRLRPGRFVVVRGPGLERLGEVFAKAHAAREPTVPAAELERTRGKPLRAPLIVAVVSSPKPSPKVPRWGAGGLGRGRGRDPTPIPPPSARSWTTNSLGPSPGPPAAGEQRAPPAAGSGCGVDQVPSVQEWR